MGRRGNGERAAWWRRGDAATSATEEDDPRERLLPPSSAPRSEMEPGAAEEDALTLEELLHSLGSFAAVAMPVTITMLASSFCALYIVDQETAQALSDAYLVYHPESEPQSSNARRVEEAVINALVIVSFFVVATLLVVVCYKFRFTGVCTKQSVTLLGYMMFSSALLLGLLGGNMAALAITQLGLPVDIFTFLFVMYNFSVVGVVAVFYQHGTSPRLAQVYLVATSVIMAWQLGQFPEWSTWALVVVLAFYDLCAVLSPCGPLKWLVQVVQEEGRPLPGLLYEAEVQQDHGAGPPSTTQPQTIAAPSSTEYYQYEQTPMSAGDATDAKLQAQSAAVATPLSEASLRERLTEFYARYNPAAIPRIDQVIERYRGRERELWCDLAEEYLAVEEDAVDVNTIKLGLGDFVFYSVLVSRSAMLDFSAMVACLVTVLTGLGGTMLLLGIYKRALPALPISIFLAVSIFFWMRCTFLPMLEEALPFYVMM